MVQTSLNNRFSFEKANASQFSFFTREGETRLGEEMSFGALSTNTRFVILGISEDIGPQMNGGFGGANNGFDAFVSKLMAVQSNQYLSGADLTILGEISCQVKFESIEKSTGWVEELDLFVEQIVLENLPVDTQLIVIGGGHNNAYPVFTALNALHQKNIQSINIDPHADCRSLTYRHSGNPFSAAQEKGILSSYHVLGLHEGYNNTFLLDYLNQPPFTFQTFEEYLDHPVEFLSQYETILNKLNSDELFCLDIDLDGIAFVPSSAMTPSGFSIEEIRRLIRLTARLKKIHCLHLPEGAPQTNTEKSTYGKMLAYFVTDFIKSQNSL